MAGNLRQLTYSVPYNLLLLTAGSVIFGIGVKAIALPHGLITGGISGVALLLYYWTGWLKPGLWYFLINTPIFNQRKLILIISERAEAIAAEILSRIHRGATYLEGRGAFSGRKKDVLLTVVNNYQLKRVEELVFNLDPVAFVIMENTFNVLGKGFSHRKVY
jgi:uncharacterized membrane-anchored protein YitT (DUF2179 family)